MFKLAHHSNGQVSISVDFPRIGRIVNPFAQHANVHLHHENDGFWLSSMREDSKDALIAALKAECPTLRIRKIKHGVRVKFPADIVAARDELDAVWQGMARERTPFPVMVHKMINHPTYRAFCGE